MRAVTLVHFIHYWYSPFLEQCLSPRRCSLNLCWVRDHMDTMTWWCHSLLQLQELKIWNSLNQFLLWGFAFDNLSLWVTAAPCSWRTISIVCLFLLQLSLRKLLIPASWNESLLWTSLGSSLFQLGFCSRSLVLLPDLTELALFIVKSLWWCHGLSWFQSGFSLSTVEAGEWLCKLSFAGPDSFWHKASRYIQH